MNVLMIFRKCIGPPEEYYHEAMNVLHYTPWDTLSSQEKYILTTDVCFS